jgi:hypothetical protein
MILFKQQAYYIGNENMFFVDREKIANSKEEAMRDLESFACRTKNRIQNRSYKCVVFESSQIKTERTITDELVDRLC